MSKSKQDLLCETQAVTRSVVVLIRIGFSVSVVTMGPCMRSTLTYCVLRRSQLDGDITSCLTEPLEPVTVLAT